MSWLGIGALWVISALPSSFAELHFPKDADALFHFFYTSSDNRVTDLSLLGLEGASLTHHAACPGHALAYQQSSDGRCTTLAKTRGGPLTATTFGFSLPLTGGDPCGGSTRSVQLLAHCAGSNRSGVLLVDEGCGNCCTRVHVSTPAACPLECARSAATGLVCGGARRGACSVGAGGSTATCVCKPGFSGAGCDNEVGLAAGVEGVTLSQPVSRVVAMMSAVAALGALALCRAAQQPPSQEKEGGISISAGVRRRRILPVCAAAALLLLCGLLRGEGAAATLQEAPRLRASCAAKTVLHYFEIGTSDFHTEAHVAGAAAAAQKEPLVGVSVDAMQLYLSRLPPASHSAVINAAVVGLSPHAASMPVFFIHPRDLITHNLAYWLRGCNSVGKPQMVQVEALKERGLEHLLRTQDVPVLSIRELLERGNGCRTKLLKLDVEGRDAHLLLGFVDFLWSWPACFADTVLWETVHADAQAQQLAETLLEPLGYARCGAASTYDASVCYAPSRDVRRERNWGSGGGGAPPEPKLTGTKLALLRELMEGGQWTMDGAHAAVECPWRAVEEAL